jgi:hypothetical protein
MDNAERPEVIEINLRSPLRSQREPSIQIPARKPKPKRDVDRAALESAPGLSPLHDVKIITAHALSAGGTGVSSNLDAFA